MYFLILQLYHFCWTQIFPLTLCFKLAEFLYSVSLNGGCSVYSPPPSIGDGRDGLQMWRVAANYIHNQSRRADKEWFSSLGVWWGANGSLP